MDSNVDISFSFLLTFELENQSSKFFDQESVRIGLLTMILKLSSVLKCRKLTYSYNLGSEHAKAVR